MPIYEICIRRPVFAMVLSLLMVLIGLICYQSLTVREYPNIDEPIVSVTTQYNGANADIIETQVTQVLEDSLAGIDGINVISSRSRSESSRITVRFKINIDPDAAASEVRDRVTRVRGRLPDEIEEPVIAKVEADAQPIMYLAFTTTTLSPLEVTDFADRYVKEQLQNIPGVADVRIFGERRYSMRIWVDPIRLTAYSLTIQDVSNALRKQNIEIPSGRIESLDREFTILSRTSLATPEEFERIIIKDADGMLVRMRDIAKVELGAREERRETRFNGQEAISLGIIKQATANPLEVASGVRARLPSIIDTLPNGLSLDVAFDSSIFIEESIRSVYITILEAVALVVLVILAFLRSLRATLIPLLTIPISLIATFAIMLAVGFSVNTLTLLAMVLAIGLVVDDAIVVLENVHRHIESGMRPIAAALQGTKEIAFAVVAMTITLAAVYAPIAFNTGRTGRLFAEFAVTLAGAVVISGFIALTLSPMMCAHVLRPKESHGRFYMGFERTYQRLSQLYGASLAWTLRWRALAIAILAVLLAGGYWLFANLKSELAPVEDRGVVVIVGRAPEGATIGYLSRYVDEIAPIMRSIPEVETHFSVAGSPDVTDSNSYSRLRHWSLRDRSQQEIVAEISKELSQIPGIRAFVSNPQAFGVRSRSQAVQIVLGSTRPYDEIETYVNEFVERARAYRGLMNVDSDLLLNKPQLEVKIDRDKLADMGIEVDTVGRTLEALLGGLQVTTFNRAGEQYDVVVQVSPEDRQRPQDISELYVRGEDNEMVQLSNLVTLTETVAPKELNRFNRLRAVQISASLTPGESMGEALQFLEATAREVLPDDFRIDYEGQAREFRATQTGALMTFALALAFIYLVLSAQFESFIHPIAIIVTVPFSMAGAFLALHYAGGTLNIYSQIGLVTLIGLITKHGILIVDFANHRRAEGQELSKAIIEAAVLRLRPILMTTSAMVLGAVPLALATGAGAESRHQIGWVVVGGMTLGTLLTLYVVPVVFSFLAGRRRPVLGSQAEPAE